MLLENAISISVISENKDSAEAYAKKALGKTSETYYKWVFSCKRIDVVMDRDME